MRERRTDTTAHAGTITRLHPRGYGVIRPDDGGGYILFHPAAVMRAAFAELRTGDRVSVVEGEAAPSGTRYAVEVRRVGAE